jgi:hypothetical protein
MATKNTSPILDTVPIYGKNNSRIFIYYAELRLTMNNDSKLVILTMIAATLALGIVSASTSQVFADNNSVNVKQDQKTHINQNGGGSPTASTSQSESSVVCNNSVFVSEVACLN